ncbi:MAG TPA: SDR family NAD(P)-dependent oxidoreductase [Chitinophagaceae bacterium]|nr:SDR family NAD(P)-dependent oxidoreductase [Chitinophagaceae bacterium]
MPIFIMEPIVFITGATSGFGAACARRCAAKGYRLILNGRRAERLQKLAAELHEAHGTSTFLLPFDVQDREAVFRAVESLPSEWQDVDVLVNNAGLAAGRDLFPDARLDDWETMIDTNLKGVLYVTRAVVPAMIRRSRGMIINIGSIAGKEVYERGNVYCATKHAVDALSQAMRIDLLAHNIRVTAIHPGAAETEFSLVRFKGDAAAAQKVYEGFTPLQAEDIASIVLFAIEQPPHVCISDLVVMPTQQANAYLFHKK